MELRILNHCLLQKIYVHVLGEKAFWRYLGEGVEEARGSSLRLGVGDLHSKLKAQRQIASHEEPGREPCD